MNILMPMAGAGQRFKDAGYEVSKPAIPTYDLITGKKLPMVVCATSCLPGVEKRGGNIIYVERDFHREDGTEKVIKEHYPDARFLVADHLTEGQACTCLLAKALIDTDEELLIAGCDNGMEMDHAGFELQKREADMLVFTYRHNEAVLKDPNAYGWVVADKEDNITSVSVKRSISARPMEDHAIVSSFWFRKGRIFVEAAGKMIAEDDRVNGEFYVDQAVKHVLALGYRAKVYEIERYIGWGTPEDYENFQKTFEYWDGFCRRERLGRYPV